MLSIRRPTDPCARKVQSRALEIVSRSTQISGGLNDHGRPFGKFLVPTLKPGIFVKFQLQKKVRHGPDAGCMQAA